MAVSLPLRTASLELRALATQASLLVRARRSEAPSAPEPDAPRAVVLVHGFMAAPAVLAPLADHLRTELGQPVCTFGYPSHRSFEWILDGLAEFVDSELPRDATLGLVGHSLGGLVCRAYAQGDAHGGRVDRLVTIACPHRGTRVARALPTRLGRALRPGSEHLTRLAHGDARLTTLPRTVIVAEHDHLVAPGTHAPDGDAHALHVVPGVSHNAVLYDARTFRLVTDALR